MNSGVIADRYAFAFYGYAKEEGFLDEVYEQTSIILSHLGRVRDFYLALCEKTEVGLDAKMSLLEAAVDPRPVRPEFRSLLKLLIENDRMESLQLILLDFLYMYREKHNIRTLLVTTAVADDRIPKILAGFAERDLKTHVVLQTRVNPEILGGFICESWEYCCDLSVKSALIRANKRLTESIID